MKKFKIVTVCMALVTCMVYAIAAYAYPAPGPGAEVYVTYYSDAARTNIVGVRGISHDSSCSTWHATWGSTTSHSIVTVTPCPGGSEYEF